jgi:hypothetical protein
MRMLTSLFIWVLRSRNMCHVRLVNCLKCFGRGLVGNCTKLVSDRFKSKTLWTVYQSNAPLMIGIINLVPTLAEDDGNGRSR